MGDRRRVGRGGGGEKKKEKRNEPEIIVENLPDIELKIREMTVIKPVNLTR
jgi:hypothetical protein